MDSSPLVLLSILFLSFPPSFSLKPHALVTPVTRDPSTLQYIMKVNQRTPPVSLNLVVNLGGQYLWVDCDKGYVSSTYRPVRCGSSECSAASSTACSLKCLSKRQPGCNNNTCLVTPENPFTGIGASSELATDVFSLRSTDGNKSGPSVRDPHLLFSCGHTSLLKGLARGTTGVIGLGRSKVTPPEQLAATFGFQRTFAICLSNPIGYMFFGNGPYIFQGPGIDVSKSLSHTPLIVNPVGTAERYTDNNSLEYFIGVTAIKINEKPIKLNGTLLTINKNGIGGTKISTVHPYTLLERSIYKAVLGAFGTALSQIQAKRVAPVSPFKLCFDAMTIQSTRVGPAVPSIDLVLQSSNVYWSIFGTNSLVLVRNGPNDDALCLGFVDAGINPTTSIVIGGYQLEDNFLKFDLARSRLGFSSSLITTNRTSCANFYY